MGLRDELEWLRPGGICSVGLLLRELDAATSKEFAELVDDYTVSSGALSRLTKKKGWRPIGEQAFARHRRKDCKCR